VIIGPTAAGKSALALGLARQLGLAIVSADSRQLYAGFDVGTAKPSMQERTLVPHFGIDVAPPEERYSANKWAEHAERWIAQAESGGTPPVIVGGTGFYVKALLHPLARSPELPGDARTAWSQWMDQQELVELRRWVRRLDPARAHLGRTQLYRAIETAMLAGVRLGDVLARDAHDSPGTVDGSSRDDVRAIPRAVRYLVVDPGPVLAERIRQRVLMMLEGGWISEVEALMAQVPSSAPAWMASGYDAVRRHVRGALSLDAAREQIVIETRQYAKRQRTWCRHQLSDGPVTHVSPDDPLALERVIDWWQDSEEHA
jgi:tRNA dimethylallyltransferase